MEAAVKTPPGSTDRLIEALSTIAALLDRTINEVRVIDSDFQNRMFQAVHETESSLQQQAADHLETAVREADRKARSEITEELEARFRAEMDAAIQQIRTETDAERQRLKTELERAQRDAAQFRVERDKATEEAAAQASNQAAVSAAAKDAAMAEIARVERVIKELSAVIDDPGTDLSTGVRKNVEKNALECYLKGIRFIVSGK